MSTAADHRQFVTAAESGRPRLDFGALTRLAFQPASTIRALGNLSLFRAWLVHGVGLLAGGFVLGVLGDAHLLMNGPWVPVEVALGLIQWFFDELARGLHDPSAWRDWVVQLGAPLVAIEAGTVCLAWLLMAWGAGDERKVTSFQRSLRRVWLLTPHGVVWLVIVGGISQWLGPGRSAWAQPVEMFGLSLTVLGGWVWAVWAVLAGTAGGAERAHCRWPALCGGCGYSLLGLSQDQGCPECGEPVSRSVADRPGLGVSQVWGTLAVWGEALRRPRQLGTNLQVFGPRPSLGPTVALGMGGVWVVTYAGFLGVTAMDRFPGSSVGLMWVAGLLATVAATLALGLTLGAASVVGGLKQQPERTLMAATIQGAAALGGLQVIWTAAFWGMMVAGVALQAEVRALADWLGLDVDQVSGGALTGLMALMLVVYLDHLWRIAGGARYANR
jgi:hypothetical protein